MKKSMISDKVEEIQTKFIRTDIQKIVDEFKSKLTPDDRYTSFDYCYSYFRTTTPDQLTTDIEKSCLALGYYLASWGMLRNSFLLQKSAKHFQPTIQYIAQLDNSVLEIDVDNYSEKNIKTIIEIYTDIKKRIILNGNMDLTLINKILLGVFGFIPAFDNYFCNSFRDIFDGRCGFRRVNENSLDCIKQFYKANKTTIDSLSKNTFTTDFLTEQNTKINYPKAKIIDMYGFMLKNER
jgi:hypothetical protein